MKVIVKGSTVNLAKQDFIASGGEGAVYGRGSTAFKIYHDPAKMIPIGKIQELGSVNDPRVVKPIDVLYEESGTTPIGYTMPLVTKTLPLVQLFPRAFREREGVDPQKALNLVRNLQSLVSSVHAANVLIVDLNEMNFLVRGDFTDIYALDADSWQTPHFRATALMESVRDRHMKSPSGPFTFGTDWFSFAVVSFQIFIGIHPYKGKHPTVRDLDGRMAKNLSVLNPSVNRPQVCYPLDVIPPVYLAWYEAMLERGIREAPPVDLTARAVTATPIAPIKSTQRLEIVEVRSESYGITQIAFSPTQIFTSGESCALGVTPGGVLVKASFDSYGNLKLTHGQSSVPYTGFASAITAVRGQIYALSNDHLIEVTLTETSTQLLASPTVRAEVLPRATRLYAGVAMSNLLGSAWAYLLPRSGYCAPIRLKELDGRRVVDARFEPLLQRGQDPSGVLVVVSEKSGHYDRFVFRFSPAFQSYDVEVVPDVGMTSVNFAVLDSGVCVLMDEDERLVLFSSMPGSATKKVVEDPSLSGNMRLHAHGTTLYVTQGQKVYTMRLR